MADALRHDEATSATLRHAHHDTALAESKMLSMKDQLDTAAQALGEQQKACWALQVEVQQKAGDTRRALKAWVDARFTPPATTVTEQQAADAATAVADAAAAAVAGVPPLDLAAEDSMGSEPKGLSGSSLA